MVEKILLKSEIPRLFKELSQEYSFFAPTKVKGNIEFNKVKAPEEIELDYSNSKVPPKEVLFPRMETLFYYKTNGKDIEIEPPKDLNEKYLIFGIRACDAYSFNLLEQFFNFGKFTDTLFVNKKKKSLLIGIGCNNPRETCFCTSLGGHPFKKDYLDLILTDLGEKYLVKAISEKGKDLVQQLSWLTNPEDNDLKNAIDLMNRAELSIKTKVNLENVPKILESNFKHPLWNEISENCMGCGTCSYLCPTCTCFDVVDENDAYNHRGKRIRLWDTCQFCLYTLHTSGYNPRNSRIERCRNRILHKFSYYPKNYNLFGCVGCGRCIQLCPVNNDLRTIIKKINSIKKEKEETIIA